MSDTIEAKEIYCPECDTNYDLAWSSDDQTTYVVCDCDEAEEIGSFIGRFTDEHEDDGGPHGRMFQ
jgi:hypothetical protein